MHGVHEIERECRSPPRTMHRVHQAAPERTLPLDLMHRVHQPVQLTAAGSSMAPWVAESGSPVSSSDLRPERM